MANTKQKREAGDLNNLYLKNRRGTPTQAKLDELKKELEKFKEQAAKHQQQKPEDLTELLKFGKKEIDKIQERIDNRTGVKNKPGMVRQFPLIKGSHVFTRVKTKNSIK